MATIVVTDSSAHIPAELIKEHGIRVVPFHISFEGDDFLEGEKYSHQEFYQKLSNCREFPTTSQPSVGEFIEVFTKKTAPGLFFLTMNGKRLLLALTLRIFLHFYFYFPCSASFTMLTLLPPGANIFVVLPLSS